LIEVIKFLYFSFFSFLKISYPNRNDLSKRENVSSNDRCNAVTKQMKPYLRLDLDDYIYTDI
jgi:hypothetical protein